MRISSHRFSVPNCIFQDDLPDAAFKVLVFLFSCSSVDGCASPGYDLIRENTGLSRRAAVYAIALLKKRGWFLFVRKGGPKKAIYFLRIPPRLLGVDTKMVPGRIVQLP